MLKGDINLRLWVSMRVTRTCTTDRIRIEMSSWENDCITDYLDILKALLILNGCPSWLHMSCCSYSIEQDLVTSVKTLLDLGNWLDGLCGFQG
jgi:hypothetical protein